MDTININFINEENFKNNLSDVKFNLDDKNILVKIFTGNSSISSSLNTLKIIRKYIPNGIIVGATSSNQLLEKNIYLNSTIVSITSFKNSFLKAEKVESDSKNSSQIGQELAYKLKGKNLKLTILFADNSSINTDEFIDSFSINSNEEIYISGGISSRIGNDKISYLIFENEIVSSGVVGVGVYSKSLRISLKYSYDFDPIGKKLKVQKVSKNVLKQIDGNRPKDLYLRYFGKDIEYDFLNICKYFPLITKKDDFFITRNVIDIDENGYFHYSGNLYKDEDVYIGVINVNKILNKFIHIYNQIDEHWDTIFIYSCKIRKIVLDIDNQFGINLFTNIATTCGFFSGGDFFKEPNQDAFFLNETFTILMMSEDTDVKKISKEEVEEVSFSFLGAFSNIINQITKENIINTNILNNLVLSQAKKLKHTNQKLNHELYFDSLTKLKNRKSILKDIKKFKPKSLLLIDIQSFRTFNDLHGEQVGNILLKNFAHFLEKITEDKNIIIYRLYGNTFALVNLNTKDKNELINDTQNIIHEVENNDFSFKYNDVTLDFALSIRVGISTSLNGKNLIENADMALSYAKRINADFITYNSSLEIEKLYEKDIQIIKTAKDALANDRIVPYFQSIYKKDFLMYESLVRLIKDDGTVLTPYHFLDIVKSTKIYFQITRRMIEKTFKIFQYLPYEFSINLSYLDIKNSNTLDFIDSMLIKYNIKNRLTIEIIESDTFKDYDIVTNFLKTLKSLNIKIAIDDFGSGYSNFTHLVELDPDYIKLDGSLIKDIDTNIKTFDITKSIVEIAKKLDIKVIVEFIHSKEVYEKVQTLNVDGYQGFYLGKPKGFKETFKALS